MSDPWSSAPLTPEAGPLQANIRPTDISPPAKRWRLWVDGCGGYLLLGGDRWSVGGWSHDGEIDVAVRADWPRLAGHIEREKGDYFWSVAQSKHERILLSAGAPLPVPGSAEMLLERPTPLSESAVLRLRPPHRFDDHVDGVILVQDTLLIGATQESHIRARGQAERIVVVRRGDRWLARAGLTGDFEQLRLGERMTLNDLAMTLESE